MSNRIINIKVIDNILIIAIGVGNFTITDFNAFPWNVRVLAE